jgi:hypothetical protein
MSGALDPGQWILGMACLIAYVVLAIRWRRYANRRKR